MAHWYRKKDRNGVPKYVFVFTFTDGNQVQVKPRSMYSHLDSAEDYNVDAWVAEWSRQFENKKVQPNHILFSDDLLAKHLDDYSNYLRDIRALSTGTRRKYDSLLRRYALPFFLSQELKDPQQWPGVSVRLYTYLREIECSQVLIAEVNNALRGFYRWLQDEGLVAFGGELRLRNSPREKKKTPLAFTLTPEDVLKFVRQQRAWEIRILALLGYFFSLRSQEIFAAKADCFRAGQAAQQFECAKANAQAGLFDQLVFEVRAQQRSIFGEISVPKAHSQGWVACFNEEAAALLLEILNSQSDLSLQFLGRDNRAIYRAWELATKGSALENIDLKDLRRASLYHLGHYSKLTLQQLQKAARHRQQSTTELYTRRPEEHSQQQPTVGGFAFTKSTKAS